MDYVAYLKSSKQTSPDSWEDFTLIKDVFPTTTVHDLLIWANGGRKIEGNKPEYLPQIHIVAKSSD